MLNLRSSNTPDRLTFKAGFTLIELLVVIAIIGTLSSIVLASLSNSRSKATDTAIKADVAGIRSAAESYYNDNSYSYGTQSYSTTCGASGGAIFGDTNVQKYIDDAVTKSGVDAKCASGNTWYVIAVPYKSNSANAWCVDNVGSSRQITWSTFLNGDQNCTQAGS